MFFGALACASASIFSCSFQVLQNVQKLIEEQQLQHYSNIRGWAKALGTRVEGILLQRLVRLVEEWTLQFSEWPNKGTALIQNGVVLEIQVCADNRYQGAIYLTPLVKILVWFTHLLFD